MLIKVTEKDVTVIPDSGQYCTEASAIGLCPGRWPSIIPTDLGNEEPFELQGNISSDVILYKQPKTFTELQVLND